MKVGDIIRHYDGGLAQIIEIKKDGTIVTALIEDMEHSVMITAWLIIFAAFLAWALLS